MSQQGDLQVLLQSTQEALVMVPRSLATHPAAAVTLQSTPKTTRATPNRHTTNPEPALLQSTAQARPNMQEAPSEAPWTLQDTPNTGGDKPKKLLRRHVHGQQLAPHVVTLSQHTAKAMADSFFKFVEQEHLQPYLSPMTAGQILVLCIFHSRLAWQKEPPLKLHERDFYWIPKPVFTPASQEHAPSPPHFVEQIQNSATEHVPPEMQPPRTCFLCDKRFIDSSALWKHHELQHQLGRPYSLQVSVGFLKILLTLLCFRGPRKIISGATKSA